MHTINYPGYYIAKYFLLALVFTILLTSQNLLSQTITWEKVYGNVIGSNEAKAIVQTPDEGYIVGGRNIFGLIILRLNKYGDTLWTKILPGSICTEIKKTNDGNYLVLGQFTNVTKININGDILWTVGPLNTNAFSTKIVQLPDSGYIMCGSKDTLGILQKPHIIKINSTGTLMWERTYSSGIVDGIFREMVISQSNEILFTGGYSDVDTITNELFIMKTDLFGNPVFFYGYDTLRRCYPSLISLLNNSNIVITGHLNTGPFFIKINQAGNILAYKKYMDNVTNDTRGGTATNDGGYALTGWWDTVGNSFDYAFLIKTDSLENEQWRKVYGANDDYRGNTVLQTLDSGYIIGGIKYRDIYLVKTDAGGVLNPIGIQPVSTTLPVAGSLSQNYPNPFNPVTTIKYEIPKDAGVTIKVYDLLGKVIFIFNEFKKAGSYELNFDSSNFSSGIYIYELHSGNFTDSKKMVLLK